jgi:hypothetical protein
MFEAAVAELGASRHADTGFRASDFPARTTADRLVAARGVEEV